LDPGIDEPRLAPFVDEPVVVGVAVEAPVPDPPPDVPLCASASVLVSANAPAKASVESFIASPPVCCIDQQTAKGIRVPADQMENSLVFVAPPADRTNERYRKPEFA
jgi:hypothetical protein